jgi:hypothetical protein
MDYLTNYYKNLSEQLQEKVNHLENTLLEYKKSGTRFVQVDDVENTGDEEPLLTGRMRTKAGNPVGKGAAKDKTVAFWATPQAMPNYGPGTSATDDAWETISDSGRPDVETNPIYANLRGQGRAQEVMYRELDTQDPQYRRTKGGSVKGTGVKARKKQQAIDAAQKHDINPTDNVPVYRTPNF